jgi:hypothetical protein
MATHSASSPSLILPLALAGLACLMAEPSARAEIVDRVGGMNHQRGAGALPFFEKQRALERLGELRDEVAAGAGDVGDLDHALEELDDAIEELGESLDPEFWVRDELGMIEGLHLDPEEGAHVFHEERHCAQEIFDAIRLGEIGDLDLQAELLAIVDALVLIDRRLAEIQIDDAVAGGGDPEEIDEALAELARGDGLVKAANATSSLELRAALLYEAMDNAYRHAWEAAIDALEEGAAPLSADSHSDCGKGQCGGLRWSHRKPA